MIYRLCVGEVSEDIWFKNHSSFARRYFLYSLRSIFMVNGDGVTSTHRFGMLAPHTITKIIFRAHFFGAWMS